MTISRITDPVLFAAILRFISDTNLRHHGNPSDREIVSRFPSWSSHEINTTIRELLDLGYIARVGLDLVRRPNAKQIYAVTETGLSRLRGVTA